MKFDPDEPHAGSQQPAGPLTLFFALDEFRAADIAAVIHLLSDVCRAIGGDALVIDQMTLLQESPVPQRA